MDARWLHILAPLLAVTTLASASLQAVHTVSGQARGSVHATPNEAIPPGGSIPSVQASTPTLDYARYFFSTDSINSAATQASRWPLLIGQGNQQAGAKRVKQADPTRVRTVVYADPLFIRQSDPAGVTTTTNNASTLANHREWLLHTASGANIKATNFTNKDYAADIGNTAYQQASIQFLLAKIRADGWNGVFLDDTNPSPSYTFSARPAKYPTDASWQAAELAYVRTVCGAIRDEGFRCYINLGQRNTTWAQSVAKLSSGPMTEFFVAMDPNVGGQPTLATVENGYWTPQLTWAKWAEANTAQQIVHASTTDPSAITYALSSFLLVSNGRGSFAANRDYGSSTEGIVFPKSMTDARSLGAPTNAAIETHLGVYYRNFVHGQVVVNPHSDARTFGTRTLPAASGTVTLR